MESEFISLDAASKILSVSVEVLLEWNEHNILKPIITTTGQVGYRKQQIDQFLAIREQLSVRKTFESNELKPHVSSHKRSPGPVVFALVVSFFITISVMQFVVPKLLSSGDEMIRPDLAIREDDPAFKTSNPDLSGSEQDLASVQLDNEVEAVTAVGEVAGAMVYSQVANFEVAPERSDEVFDTNGNIKGEAVATGVLATTIFANGLIPDSIPVSRTFDSSILLILAVPFLMTIPFVFRRHPRVAASSPSSSRGSSVLELNQKTDGSIVLTYCGQDYKISKPELDSESDQFIERLLTLVTPSAKEIDYDASKDNEVTFNAPLSKLVTRLGFVGLKRDLFFPRTSKNRVLFRRYLTEEDLTSMNIDFGQLSNEFSAVS